MEDVSNSELEVMHLLWRTAPLSANEIVEQLQSDLGWHDKTIRTLINRLLKKGAIAHEKIGRQFIYSPAIDKQTYLAQQSQTFLQRVFRGSFSGLLSGFAKSDNLSRQDIDELKRFIDDWEKKND